MTNQEKSDIIVQMADLADKLGWSLILPVTKDDSVPGLIFGTLQFLDSFKSAMNDDGEVFIKNNKPTSGAKNDPNLH